MKEERYRPTREDPKDAAGLHTAFPPQQLREAGNLIGEALPVTSRSVHSHGGGGK